MPGQERWGLKEVELFESSQDGPTTEQREVGAVYHSFARRHLRESRAVGMTRLVATKAYLKRRAGAAGEETFRAMRRLASGCPEILAKSAEIIDATEEWKRPCQNDQRDRLRQRVVSLLYDFTAVVESERRVRRATPGGMAERAAEMGNALGLTR